MKTIYSILYVTLNAALNERVSIGIVMSNSQQHFYKFSNEKLSVFKTLLDTEKFNLIKKYLLSLEKELVIDGGSNNKLFSNKDLKSNWLSESYISYLSKYSNNIIQFSQPKSINIDFNYDNFKRLFEKYVHKFEVPPETAQVVDIYTRVRENLFPKIESQVNIEISLNSDNFENLFAPIEIDFLGMNNVPLAGQTIDFEKKHYYLENDITRFVSLTKAIELAGSSRGKYYILGREPHTNGEKNHLLWEHIRDSEFLEFVDIDEYGIVEEYIKTHDVKPYFQE